MSPVCLLVLLCSSLSQPGSVRGWGAAPAPSESECRPYIEKALKAHTPQEAVDATGSDQVSPSSPAPEQEESIEEPEESKTSNNNDDESEKENDSESTEAKETSDTMEVKKDTAEEDSEVNEENLAEKSEEISDTGEDDVQSDQSIEEGAGEAKADQPSIEDGSESAEIKDNIDSTEQISNEDSDNKSKADEFSSETPDEVTIGEKDSDKSKSEEETLIDATTEPASVESGEGTTDNQTLENNDTAEEATESDETLGDEESFEITGGEVTDSSETQENITENVSNEDSTVNKEETIEESDENTKDTEKDNQGVSAKEVLLDSSEKTEEVTQPTEGDTPSIDEADKISTEETSDETKEENTTLSSELHGEIKNDSLEDNEFVITSKSNLIKTEGGQEGSAEESSESHNQTEAEVEGEEGEGSASGEPEPTIEDQLTLEFEAPAVRRPRDHITDILRLSPEAAETELLLAKTIDSTLKELKKLYDAAIKPLEILYKYRDLSNRHFGDPEIFSKPLILFMGPWSGGKSTIVNYLLDNEFKSSSLRTGAEPSPAYFNILMWGEREEVLDGTQLAADWTFSGLQKFGQGLLDRLRGLRLNSPVLEKVNIVEIPGILEIRKQVERLFPFNDACQWFIDRADIIFLVYDPSKLDVGPETEAILDQLKGREYQTRIILNKADQVKPEELMRVQGTLIWNISPLMSSTEPPVMYSTSLWSLPYEQGAPSRLLHAQERAFLRDLRQAVDKRVENKIASARRFAVRVRNHAKMVDCYLTTYYNHKSFFGNKKKVADDIIEHPQNYHIYEGLSTLTNISRYDLPDPEVYRDFFRLNPLYDFQRLSDTCTYFRGCPINRLDVAIAYDLPELVGKYKKQAEKVLEIAAEKQANKS